MRNKEVGLEATEKDWTETQARGKEETEQAGNPEETAAGPEALTPKMLDLMERLSEYGFLTMAEIHFVFGNKTWAYGVMNDLRKQGLVADFDTQMSPRKGHHLTHKGYRVLGKFQRLRVGLRFKMERYSTFIFRHRLACAKVGITLAKHPNVKEFMPESRLWKRRKKATDKLCDGEFWYKVPDHEKAERVGLEVELTLKNQGKLDESMEQLGRRKDLDQVWWLCGDTTTLKAVRREVQRRDYWLAPQRHFFILFEEFLAAKGKAELMDPEGQAFTIDAAKPTLLPRQAEAEPEPRTPAEPVAFYSAPPPPQAEAAIRPESVPPRAVAPVEWEPSPPGLVERLTDYWYWYGPNPEQIKTGIEVVVALAVAVLLFWNLKPSFPLASDRPARQAHWRNFKPDATFWSLGDFHFSIPVVQARGEDFRLSVELKRTVLESWGGCILSTIVIEDAKGRRLGRWQVKDGSIFGRDTWTSRLMTFRAPATMRRLAITLDMGGCGTKRVPVSLE
ncbi:MAG: replication-relaxation family protein [Elusimicrobiota bacterium]|nr:MAG: replication-relaxation family protein [Elusimicrobiota bacterium]